MSNSQYHGHRPHERDGEDDCDDYDYEHPRGRNVYSAFEGANGFVIDGGMFIAGGYEGQQRPHPSQRAQTLPTTHYQYKNASNFRISSGTFISGMVPEPANMGTTHVNPAPPQRQYQHGYNPNMPQSAPVTPGYNAQNGIFEPGKGPPYTLHSQYSQYPTSGENAQAHQTTFNPQTSGYPSSYPPPPHIPNNHQQMPSAYAYNHPQPVRNPYSSSLYSLPTPPESFAPSSRYVEDPPTDASEDVRAKRTHKFANLFKKKDR